MPTRRARYPTREVLAHDLATVLPGGGPLCGKGGVLVWLANNYLAQSAYKVLQLAAPVGWRRFVERRRGLDGSGPSTSRGRARHMGLGRGGCRRGDRHGHCLFARPGRTIRSRCTNATRRHRRAVRHDSLAGPIGRPCSLPTLNSGLEELHFRVWLDRELSRRYGDAVGIIFSAAAFAAMHLFIFANMRGIAAAAFACSLRALFAVAVAWSLLARRPGGIHAAWLSHALTDAGLMTWGLFWLGYFCPGLGHEMGGPVEEFVRPPDGERRPARFAYLSVRQTGIFR